LQASPSLPSHAAPVSVVASSTEPLQLLSSPSHSSAEGVTLLRQSSAPATQAVRPVRHTPCRAPPSQASGEPEHVHDASSSTRSATSSTSPSQSLSRPSQTSACATHGGERPVTCEAMSSKSLSPPRKRSSKPK
jgi:hypothetical protein